MPDEVKAAVNAQDFTATALSGHRPFTVAEAIVWNAVYGPTAASHAAQAARSSSPSYAKNVIARAVAQAKCAQVQRWFFLHGGVRRSVPEARNV